jgi:hypothetical protein
VPTNLILPFPWILPFLGFYPFPLSLWIPVSQLSQPSLLVPQQVSSSTSSSSKLLRSVYFLHASIYESRLSSVPKESASTSRSQKTKDTLGYDLICRSAHEAERELEPTIGYSVWIAVWKHKGVTLDQSPSK